MYEFIARVQISLDYYTYVLIYIDIIYIQQNNVLWVNNIEYNLLYTSIYFIILINLFIN